MTLATLLLYGCGGCDFGAVEDPCAPDRCGMVGDTNCGDCSDYHGGCGSDPSEPDYYCSAGHCVSPSCGNGVVETPEKCERGTTILCTELVHDAYLDGTATCAYNCNEWDTSSCVQKNWCGNGVLEEDNNELCETGDTLPCAELDAEQFLKGAATCDDYCVWDSSACTERNVCGNGVIEPEAGEICEGSIILCTDISDQFLSGYASCVADCSGWDKDDCIMANVCGNGVVEPEAGEVCERYDPIACAALDSGYTGGYAYCLNDCSDWDISACTTPPSTCGNGVIDDVSEECEAGMGIPCVEIDPAQYVYGTAPCNSECSGWSVAPCLGTDACGNGIFELGEECEITDTIPCTEIDPVNYLPGNAPCLSDCSGWDPSLCATVQVCGNGIVEEGETCDTLPVACAALDPLVWALGTAPCRADCEGWDTGDCLEVADPDDMVDIPGGPFFMGCDAAQWTDCLQMEKPEHAVTLSPYAIDRYEVTVAQYQLCIAAGKCTGSMHGAHAGATACNLGSERDPRMPVNCVSWNGAAAYCKWKGKRLPTEAEWEYAARGPEGWPYPWGTVTADCGRASYDAGAGAGCGTGATSVIGLRQKGKSLSFDLYDMAGNVREWVADRYVYDYYWGSPVQDPQGPVAGDMRVARGGSWKSDARSLKTYARYANYPTTTYTDLGFRCAK